MIVSTENVKHTLNTLLFHMNERTKPLKLILWMGTRGREKEKFVYLTCSLQHISNENVMIGQSMQINFNNFVCRRITTTATSIYKLVNGENLRGNKGNMTFMINILCTLHLGSKCHFQREMHATTMTEWLLEIRASFEVSFWACVYIN
jgi:hypothetical protein